MKLIQESDEIAYRCAFSCQKTAYTIRTKHKVFTLAVRRTKTELVEYLKCKGKVLDVHYTLEPYIIAEPKGIVAYTLDKMVTSLHSVPGVTEVELWLSSSKRDNFRYDVAKLTGPKGNGYKAGRPDKPIHLDFIRNRLIKKWGAKEISGFEADDALGMYQTSDTIISHIDKDINMISGKHYNHVTGEVYDVPEGLGTLEYENKKLKGRGVIFFYAQLLTGDSTDNIPGIRGIGDKRAYDLLKSVSSEKHAYDVVQNEYVKQYGAQWQQAIEEISDLLWICRRPDETGKQYLQHRGYLK